MTSVGFVGLGTMGAPMARNVLKAGHALTVFDLNPVAVKKLVEAGARAAASPREVAQQSEIVITMLPDAPDVEAAVLGADGIGHGLRAGSLYIDMSTIDPQTTQRIGAWLAQRGVDMIDSPVGKTVEHAIAGTSTLMIGGDAAVLERARPILSSMGADLIHCGGLGMGQAMKLTNNLLASVLITASSEALVAGAKAGLTLDTMINVLKTTMAWNQQLAVAMHNRALKGDFEPGFMVKLAHKDCRLALAMNDALGVETPVGGATLAVLREAMDAGMAGKDVGAVLKLREDATGVQVRLAGA
ncbi:MULTISPECIES: NAD(P)-dependent oxidoreductase [unclassified Mesorhizobium]|uniref:NAD(P)-dependent oxidoreductase n=1 Tax=unclassified Mesorhizobium TaxID=325217 RepID=UPI00112944AF|nr:MULTISPECIES: NAD(P)-dependent oxidoreductase [unclassified Mesorhizobium]TPJ41350.1 NAD(P)-dependent oxidoreductase [Mesorhizobium sp. B2-6-6]MBZ9702817.1 NAD(P)-dependent oxidoreductase [Mesorhizobium sp. CO1-1-3]MBZ9948464.1 NAD(P)-dependent oxidoreductase [Mesorhizobium sp. BR1-1-11]MBZ9982052.1 NAD(P)-dependent oxidoreductase [Mesorhizobium sp. BR-1-1-8]MCA0002369.1 NAD(P)-dependent oxidoreductase [Mesorhizobium sp. B264B2A]